MFNCVYINTISNIVLNGWEVCEKKNQVRFPSHLVSYSEALSQV